MNQSQIERTIETLERLPEAYQREALDFIEFLRAKTQAGEAEQPAPRGKETPSEQEAALLKLIGIVRAEPFADRIDDTLYGSD